MNEEELNELVKEHYGFSVEEMDENVGNLSLRVNQLEYNNKKLQQENQSLKDRIEKAIKIFEECKLLMPHEFDWGEQFENAIQKLKGDKE